MHVAQFLYSFAIGKNIEIVKANLPESVLFRAKDRELIQFLALPASGGSLLQHLNNG